MKIFIALFFSTLTLISCSSFTSKQTTGAPTDLLSNDLKYLESINSPEVRRFAEMENVLSIARLKTDPLFSTIEKEILDIVTAKDKLPAIWFHDGQIYQFWQDQVHIRGQLKRTTINDFNNHKPNWEIVFDLDELAKSENINWVWKSLTCYKKRNQMCLLFLSDGGKDATVAREYDLYKKEFIKDGFVFPESKSQYTWYDENTLLFSDATDSNKLTNSGYPLSLKLISRGRKISDAPKITEVPKDYVRLSTWVTLENNKLHFLIFKNISFYENEVYYLSDSKVKNLIQIPIPKDADIETIFKDQLLFTVKTEYKIKNKIFPPGTLLSIPLSSLETSTDPEVVFTPSKTEFLQGVANTKDRLWLSVLHDVKRTLKPMDRVNHLWQSKKFLHAKGSRFNNGNWSIHAIDTTSNKLYLSYTDFLTPTQIYFSDSSKRAHLNLKYIQSTPSRFDSANLISEQFKTKSKDGTLIPYFIIHAKDIKLNGKNPTLQYGYGGFEYALTPYYMAVAGKVWLSRGHVYVIANIRGGGEYGPMWHKAAIGANRQRAFDDFIAVSEDLIRRKITSPEYLGIMGGSNGGLLTSVMLTQRPDLYKAVVSEVPLTNMLRFNKLLAGASWQAEYGNPDIPSDREYLMKYSPLHNIKRDARYPEAFYITSTKDDRVHPAHARQMVSRLKQLGHSVLYYENIDGGHGRAANLKEYATMLGMEYTYLFQKLTPEK